MSIKWGSTIYHSVPDDKYSAIIIIVFYQGAYHVPNRVQKLAGMAMYRKPIWLELPYVGDKQSLLRHKADNLLLCIEATNAEFVTIYIKLL